MASVGLSLPALNTFTSETMTNVFKSVVAAAAVTACCMGNQYPAKSHHNHGPSEGYAAGAIYGATCSNLLGYTTEQQSADFLLTTLAKRGMDADDITPRVRSIAQSQYKRNKCQDFKQHVGDRAAVTYAL